MLSQGVTVLRWVLPNTSKICVLTLSQTVTHLLVDSPSSSGFVHDRKILERAHLRLVGQTLNCSMGGPGTAHRVVYEIHADALREDIPERRCTPREAVGDGVHLPVAWTRREPALLKKGLHFHQRRDDVLPVVDAELAIARHQCSLLLAHDRWIS